MRYLRLWQSGFGAVGVSSKGSTRSFARLPIFWELRLIDSLPYPDPSDAEIKSLCVSVPHIANPTMVDDSRAMRALSRTQAQEWAQLEVNPNADLFVFEGNWSKQTGFDLIADLFPTVLEKHPTAQLLCIGPIVDLYGKFGALKLQYLSRLYPRRVCSMPGLTLAPSCIYRGAEFVLLPSRDEPDSLRGLDFGRMGALGIGARVGGSEKLPGWWYTIESPSSKQLLHQLKKAIEAALASDATVRAGMRARSLEQQVSAAAQWKTDIDVLHDNAIRASQENTGQGTSGNAIIDKLAMDSVEEHCSKIAWRRKYRGGRSDLSKSVSSIQPLNFVANITRPIEARSRKLSPSPRMEPGASIGVAGCPRYRFGEDYPRDRIGIFLRYVLGHTLQLPPRQS